MDDASGADDPIEVFGRRGALLPRAIVLLAIAFTWPAVVVAVQGWASPAYDRPDEVTLRREALRGVIFAGAALPAVAALLTLARIARSAPILVADRDGLRYQLFPGLPPGFVPWRDVADVRVRGSETGWSALRLEVHLNDLAGHLATSDHLALMRLHMRIDQVQGVGAIALDGRHIEEDPRLLASGLTALRGVARPAG